MNILNILYVHEHGCHGFLQYLRVLQERRLVVSTAAAAVQHRLGMFGPASEVHHLVPRFMDAYRRGVDETTHISICKVLAPVIEGHPVDVNALLHTEAGRDSYLKVIE